MGSPHFSSTSRGSDWEDWSTSTAVSDPLLVHHEIEHLVWRELQSVPGAHFSSLTVRRVPDGVCLQGVMETDEDVAVDICDVVRRAAPVGTVVNQLVIREPAHCSRLPR